MPEIRGRIGKQERKLGAFDDQPAVLEFVNSHDLVSLGALGTSCPDHFLRTKIRPLILDFDPAHPDVDAVAAGLDAHSMPIAPTTSAITTPAATTIRRPCAIPTR